MMKSESLRVKVRLERSTELIRQEGTDVASGRMLRIFEGIGTCRDRVDSCPS